MFLTKKSSITVQILLIRIFILLLINITGEIIFWTKASAAQVNLVTPSTKIQLNPLKKIEFIGNTVFSDSELEKVLDSYKGQTISLELLQKMGQEIDNYYLQEGYLTSGSFVPAQEVQDGIIQIKIIETTLEKIQIQGLAKLTKRYFESRLPKINQPLNIDYLLQSLDKLRKDPLIKEIRGEITEEDLGKNVLLLEIEEADFTTLFLRCTNAYSPSIGSFGCNNKFTHNHLLFTGDRIILDASLTEGLSRVGFYYSFPFNKTNCRIAFEVNVAENEVILEEVKDLGIGADYLSFLLKISQPIILSNSETLTLGFAMQNTNSETTLFNGKLSFPFTKGLEDGQSRITTLNFSQEYLKNWNSTLFAFNSEFSVGINAFDATRTEVGIDGIFWLWRGDIQSLIALDKNRNVVLAMRIAGQLTPDKLLALEQFTLGGLGSVRGYIRNLEISDNGVIGTIELQINLFRDKKIGSLSLSPFVDVGIPWNNQNRETDTLASTGISLRYRFREIVEARIDWGLPLTSVREDAQDNVTGSIRFKIF